jgi:hypothetical protein
MEREIDNRTTATASRLTRTVREHPDEAIISAFVTGAVIGLVIGAAIASASSSGLSRQRRVAEGLGERVLHSLDSLLPSSLAKAFGTK